MRLLRTSVPGLVAIALVPLASASTARPRAAHTVAPGLRKIRAWISGFGSAAVALADGDGDGLPNDVCLVDPRTKSVTLAPAPSTERRYAPFLLEARPLPYDAATTAPMGCLPGDFDEDGRTDFLVYYWGRTPVLFLRDGGEALGAESFARRELSRSRERWYTNAVTSADIDGDGRLDLVIGNYYPTGARLLDADATSDPAMEMQDSMSRAYNGGADLVYLGQGEARYREAEGALPERVARGWTLALGASDLDGDLLPELYFAHDFGPDRLLVNRSTPGNVRSRR